MDVLFACITSFGWRSHPPRVTSFLLLSMFFYFASNAWASFLLRRVKLFHFSRALPKPWRVERDSLILCWRLAPCLLYYHFVIPLLGEMSITHFASFTQAMKSESFLIHSLVRDDKYVEIIQKLYLCISFML